MVRILLPFVLLAACIPDGSIDTDTDTTDTTTTPSGLTTTAVEAVCTDAFVADTSGGPEGLNVSDMGGGTVHVIHGNYMASCCLGFDAAATLSTDRIDVAYTEVGDPCDCVCPYSMGYDILGVPAGSYTVYAGSVSAAVTVL